MLLALGSRLSHCCLCLLAFLVLLDEPSAFWVCVGFCFQALCASGWVSLGWEGWEEWRWRERERDREREREREGEREKPTEMGKSERV